MWEAAATIKEQDQLQSMKAEITELRRQISNNQGNRNGDKSDDKERESKRWMRIAPKEGDSEVKTVNKIEYKYCSVCRRWRSGKNAHKTAEHV